MPQKCSRFHSKKVGVFKYLVRFHLSFDKAHLLTQKLTPYECHKNLVN